MDKRLINDRFPRASAYHPEWVLGSASSASNALWLTEWLTEAVDLRPGMRILDLGCGRAMSSIFLHREFGVQVWATDLWFSPLENYRRIRDAGVEQGVFPIHADARALPFATEFFDAIVSIDSFMYYGTEDLYLHDLARFVKPSGTIGIAQVGLMDELESSIPPHLQQWWSQDQPLSVHSAAWWERHWARTGIVDIEIADALDDGWRFWADWLRLIAPGHTTEIAAVETDAGRHLGYVRVVGRRRVGAPLHEPIAAIPIQYEQKPLFRE